MKLLQGVNRAGITLVDGSAIDDVDGQAQLRDGLWPPMESRHGCILRSGRHRSLH